MDALDDRTLVIQSQRGQTQAYGELVKRYQRPVLNVCWRVLRVREDAEDAAQETFMRGYKYLNTFDAARPFGPWIKQVAANHCYQLIKSRKIDPVELEDELDQAADRPNEQPEAIATQADESRRLRAAIAALPDHYRMVIELRHFQELDYKSISAELDLPLNTVKSHLLRARKMLMERMSEARPTQETEYN